MLVMMIVVGGNWLRIRITGRSTIIISIVIIYATIVVVVTIIIIYIMATPILHASARLLLWWLLEPRIGRTVLHKWSGPTQRGRGGHFRGHHKDRHFILIHKLYTILGHFHSEQAQNCVLFITWTRTLKRKILCSKSRGRVLSLGNFLSSLYVIINGYIITWGNHTPLYCQ